MRIQILILGLKGLILVQLYLSTEWINLPKNSINTRASILSNKSLISRELSTYSMIASYAYCSVHNNN